MTYIWKIHDADDYKARLNRFLSDKLLLFNPYLVTDELLLEGVGRMRWRGAFSLTQMVILKFRDIQSTGRGIYTQEKVIYSIGDSNEEISDLLSSFTAPHTAADSLQQVRNTINNIRITQRKQIYSLIGKRVFVSRNIITVNNRGSFGKAMRMHRLKGIPEVDAAVIREAAISARLEMLERFLSYPHANIYLNGVPPAPVDIETPIRTVMAEIAAFPETSYRR